MLDNLKNLSRDELVILAMKQGLPKPHPNAKEETIIQKIIEANTPRPVEAHVALVNKEAVFQTEEEVEVLVAHIKAKIPEFKTVYDHVARCVTFSCKGAEDCMSMSVTPRWMQTKAQSVSRGKVALRTHDQRNFDSVNVSGANAYTANVLTC